MQTKRQESDILLMADGQFLPPYAIASESSPVWMCFDNILPNPWLSL